MSGFLVLLVAYLVGSIPFGLIMGRLCGVNVRAVGSGNIGATNVLRAAGRGAGLITFLLDAGKGAAGPAVARLLDLGPGWSAGAGLAAVVGHCFPALLAFRGGKGVATLVGAFAVLDPRLALLGAAVFSLALAATRYVAVASMLLALSLVAGAAAWHSASAPLTMVAVAAAVLVAVRHRDNWSRLRQGTEGRVFTGRAPTAGPRG